MRVPSAWAASLTTAAPIGNEATFAVSACAALAVKDFDAVAMRSARGVIARLGGPVRVASSIEEHHQVRPVVWCVQDWARRGPASCRVRRLAIVLDAARAGRVRCVGWAASPRDAPEKELAPDAGVPT